MADVLRGLGAEVTIDGRHGVITTPAELSFHADFPAVGRLRASVCVLGPLMGRCRRAQVALPGGDAIGSRPLDMHQSGLRAMGATMNIEHGKVVGSRRPSCTAPSIGLDFPSVGATENILMAAVLADGTTVIDNAAREPEIIDLAQLLGQMGARIDGAGTATITIEGVDALHPTSHRTVGDRVVGGTWAYAAAITRGSVRVEGVDPAFLTAPLERLSSAGGRDRDRAGRGHRHDAGAATGGRLHHHAVPGLPDRPAADGAGAGRGGRRALADHRERLRGPVPVRRRADPDGCGRRTDGHHASLRGREQLSSAPVWSTDIRAGAGLVLAGLAADGVTEVHEVMHIDRGTRISWRTCRSWAARSNGSGRPDGLSSRVRPGRLWRLASADRRRRSRVSGCVSWWPGARWTMSAG